MQLAVQGQVSGVLSSTFTSDKDDITVNLQSFSLCGEKCRIYNSHTLAVKAQKSATPTDRWSGTLSRTANQNETYEGTISSTIVDATKGSVSLKWNDDLHIYRTHQSFWSQSLSMPDATSNYTAAIYSEANLYPLQASRSFVQSRIRKSADSSQVYQMSDPSGPQLADPTVIQPVGYTLSRRAAEDRLEKQYHLQPIQRSGTGSTSTTIGSSTVGFSGHFDSVDARLVLDAPVVRAGSRVDFSVSGTTPSYLPFALFGYPDNYLFTPGSGNATGTVAIASKPVKLMPSDIVFVDAMSDEDHKNFARTFKGIETVLSEAGKRGSNVIRTRALTAAAFKEALAAAPTGSVLIFFVHGSIHYVFPAGTAAGGTEVVSGADMQEIIDRRKLLAVFPFSCYSSRKSLSHAVLGSILPAVQLDGGVGLPSIIGLGSNTMMTTTEALIRYLQESIG